MNFKHLTIKHKILKLLYKLNREHPGAKYPFKEISLSLNQIAKIVNVKERNVRPILELLVSKEQIRIDHHFKHFHILALGARTLHNRVYLVERNERIFKIYKRVCFVIPTIYVVIKFIFKIVKFL